MKTWTYYLAIPAFCLYLLLMFTYEKWQVVDTWIAELLYGNKVIELFHYLGETMIVIAITILLLIWLLTRKQYGKALLVFVLVAGNFALNQLMKGIVERARPIIEDQLLSYSFPSGHTMASLTLLFMIAYLLMQKVASKWYVVIWGTAILLAIGAGLSRVSGGRHFMTDVIAAWSLVYVWFVVVVYVYETCRRQKI